MRADFRSITKRAFAAEFWFKVRLCSACMSTKQNSGAASAHGVVVAVRLL